MAETTDTALIDGWTIEYQRAWNADFYLGILPYLVERGMKAVRLTEEAADMLRAMAAALAESEAEADELRQWVVDERQRVRLLETALRSVEWEGYSYSGHGCPSCRARWWIDPAKRQHKANCEIAKELAAVAPAGEEATGG